jgi:hypothetical protein
MFFGLLTVVNDIAEVADGNCGSQGTTMRRMRRHRMFADLGMDKLNG